MYDSTYDKSNPNIQCIILQLDKKQKNKKEIINSMKFR